MSEVTAKMVYDVIRNLENKPHMKMVLAPIWLRVEDRLWKEIYGLIQIIWNTDDLPEDWRTAITCPIHKMGSKLTCNNYRGISVLNVTYKIFTTILAKYIEPFAENILSEYQCGFYKGHSTTDHIFTIRQVLEKCYKQNINFHELYIDSDKLSVILIDSLFMKLWLNLEFHLN